MKFLIFLFALSFAQSTPSVKQEQSKKEAKPTQEIPKPTSESTSPVTTPAGQPPSKPEASETKDKSNGWPTWGDVFWPSWALVIVTIIAVRAALKTLGAINAQVEEMKSTGAQTDKLIAESIAQTKSLIRQADSLAKSAYYTGESVAEASRSARAMEVIADKIAVSAQAATSSVSAINQQMRAYLCIVVGSAVHQERAKNLKFQAVPSIVNAGLTPAHKVCFKACAAILPHPLPGDFKFPLPETANNTAVIGPRQNMTISPIVEDFCDDSEVDRIKRGTGDKALYAWGTFTYEDIFGASHYTNFCHLYTWLPDSKVWGYYADRFNDAN